MTKKDDQKKLTIDERINLAIQERDYWGGELEKAKANYNQCQGAINILTKMKEDEK